MDEQNQPEKAVPAETDSKSKSKIKRVWSSLRGDPKGWSVLTLGAGSAVAGFVAALGSGIGFWSWQVGLAALPWIALAALAGLIVAIAVIITNRRKAAKTKWLLLTLGSIISLGFLSYLISWESNSITLPAIHDVTTDLADPPQFSVLTLRADNLDNIPGGDDGDMQGLTPRQRWARVHQDAYPDIRSVRIDRPVADVVEKARRLADDRGWDIVSVDPAAGHLEATDTVSLFRFKHDIVLRARAAENGSASIIDMRSVSREGDHDLGVNAERLREFLNDLSGTTAAS